VGIGYHRASPAEFAALLEPALPAATRRRSALAWSLVALCAGLLLSLLLAREHARLLAQQEAVELDRALERVIDGLGDQLRTCGVLIRSMQTLFAPPDAVSAQRFEAMYANLQPRASFPGMIAMVFSRRARDAEGRVHYPTELVAPLAGNEAVLGLDVNSQPPNLLALELSRDTNEPALSASFRLVQRAGLDEPIDGITLRLPVYADGIAPPTLALRRERLVGSLAVSFRVSQLIANALPQATRDEFEVRVLDTTQGLSQLLYESAGASGDAARPVRQRELRYGGRSWRVELANAAGTERGTAWIPWVTFGGGAVASLLLALWLFSLGTTRARALHLAGRLSAQYRDSEARFRALNELLPVAVVLAEARDGRIVHVNQSGRALLGMDEGQTAGRSVTQLFEDESLARQLIGIGDDAAAGALVTRMISAHQGAFWASVAVSHVEIDGSDHLLAVISDITELRELTDRLGYQATHDTLTDLYNRREFERRLELAVRAENVAPGALLYLDLDQFKLINDTSGHIAGDQLLAALGRVLSRCIGEHDVLARLGGDEFGILLDTVTPDQALAVAERVRQAVDDFSFAWEAKRYALTVSIGIVMVQARAEPDSLRELLSRADTACYMAKERGRNRVHLFSEHDLETTRRRSEMEWASRLRQALAENRFCLFYQEIQPLRAQREAAGVHFELLLRLRDEHGELVPPGAFVPAAERYHLMPQIDRWVAQTAISRFERLHPHGAAIGLCSINVSGNTLDDESFPEFVLEQLRRHRVEPERLCFEITETAAVRNMTRVAQFIQRLRAVGVRFALDDFGVGMSSFGYLKNLPVDYIKIDGSFIRELETDPMSYSIVRAVSEIGHQVGVEVVAEFVATPRARELLRGLGVDYGQGYALHVPEPVRFG
jgi:diguanylate cyclase (GGDEF)-like protein/PAS domain S-box-containing protein